MDKYEIYLCESEKPVIVFADNWKIKESGELIFAKDNTNVAVFMIQNIQGFLEVADGKDDV